MTPPPSPTRLLSVEPTVATWIALGLYAAATVALFVSVSGRASARRLGFGLLLGGFLAHGVDIGARGVAGVHPAQSVREALGLLAWLWMGGFLWAHTRFRIALAGLAVAPLVAGVLLVARMSPTGMPTEGLTTLGRLHISLATLGVALFAIAAALAALYLVEDRSLRRKRFDTLTFRQGGSPLDVLDNWGARLTWLGFPVFTVALALGLVWTVQRGDSLSRIEHLVAVIAWAAFAASLITRVAYGWRGRRSAKLTIAGFASAGVVLAVYLLRRIAETQ